jgi:hypothetical protein
MEAFDQFKTGFGQGHEFHSSPTMFGAAKLALSQALVTPEADHH